MNHHKYNIKDGKISVMILLALISFLMMSVVHCSDLNLQQSPLLDCNSETAFLQVHFKDGEPAYFRNWECPDGVWAEEMYQNREATCVCVKGAYAIASELCDEDFKILTGDNHCFDIKGQTIRKFIPLTGKSGLAGRANTVFRKDAPYFARLMSSTPTTSVAEPMHYVFRMNDPNEFTAYAKLSNGKAAKLKCYSGQPPSGKSSEPLIQIAKLPDCANEFRGPKPWCEDGALSGTYEWELSVGQSWSPKGGVGQPGSKDSCSPNGGNRQTPPRRHRKKRASGKSSPSVKQPDEPEPTCNSFDEAVMEAEEYDTSSDHFYQVDMIDQKQIFQPSSYHQKLVFEQNKRIGHQLRKFYLAKEGVFKTPRFETAEEFPEYEYIKLAKRIFVKICPGAALHVLNFLIRTFRLLYIDSSKNYPYPEKYNDQIDARITAALKQCATDADNQEIYFYENKTCPDMGVYATNQSTMTFFYGSNMTMPGSALYNSSMDAAVELIWKLTMVVHYYCLQPGQFVSFTDHSYFFVKLESILKNPLILFRWYYPGQFNQLLEFFLMSYDLRKFTQAVDQCVATVITPSNFTDYMLARPAEMLGWSAQSASKEKKLPHSGKSLIVDKPASRKRRFYLQDDMWNKQAYCMHSTDAPYKEVRTGTFLSCKKKPIWFDNTD
ncbi:hypothetical protein Ocin01_05657 [Orchesella cincta]|uniref:Uncharacterized protein n=1 Tax=Orchesella cincta TaxID=48709 RepID=A0A1D2N7T8_ORCCI|nr:hypothetical protein Ocin01_05657 [Orchesella cincta]